MSLITASTCLDTHGKRRGISKTEIHTLRRPQPDSFLVRLQRTRIIDKLVDGVTCTTIRVDGQRPEGEAEQP
jgi:hypothetical protein